MQGLDAAPLDSRSSSGFTSGTESRKWGTHREERQHQSGVTTMDQTAFRSSSLATASTKSRRARWPRSLQPSALPSLRGARAHARRRAHARLGRSAAHVPAPARSSSWPPAASTPSGSVRRARPISSAANVPPSNRHLDWGTTGFRAYRLRGDGAVAESRSAAKGILAVPPGGFMHAIARAAWQPAPDWQ